MSNKDTYEKKKKIWIQAQNKEISLLLGPLNILITKHWQELLPEYDRPRAVRMMSQAALDLILPGLLKFEPTFEVGTSPQSVYYITYFTNALLFIYYYNKNKDTALEAKEALECAKEGLNRNVNPTLGIATSPEERVDNRVNLYKALTNQVKHLFEAKKSPKINSKLSQLEERVTNLENKLKELENERAGQKGSRGSKRR